ncbi:helix-turn-helix domain-containing protein [Labilibaculum sp. K2S]|uniref:helix-turn-helix domain-containing protein n=1 Tax=Labilibaculum sp. K2S TaxID=3056386 RepID=UPI0025A4B09A|nr:helix-turn-helix domain-containing protein [Labilibaculum sp. K2S]MDM8159053.1 helix-turn-helix domain-containing protein [Labilibaculum sp. K2S]
MKYKTTNRKEIAKELEISVSTLSRRIRNLNPEFQKLIFGKPILFENQAKYIIEKVTDMNTKYE